MKLSDIPFITPRPGDEETHVLIYRKGRGYVVTCHAAPIAHLEFNDEELAVDMAVYYGGAYDMPVRRLRTYEDRRLIYRLREWFDVPTWPSWLRF